MNAPSNEHEDLSNNKITADLGEVVDQVTVTVMKRGGNKPETVVMSVEQASAAVRVLHEGYENMVGVVKIPHI